jgi:hypothetical protein
VSGRYVVVPDRHEQDRARNELRGDQNPRTLVSATDVPAAVGEDPVLAAVEKDVGRRCRSVLDGRDARDDHQRRRRRKVDADVHVHLGVGRNREDERDERKKRVEHRGTSRHVGDVG